MMKKGNIVLIKFPFTDLIGSKLRPALILLETRFDYVVCCITSNLKIEEPFDILIKPTLSNGLKKESIVKTNKIMTIDKEIVEGKLGTLTNAEIKSLNKNITTLYSLN